VVGRRRPGLGEDELVPASPLRGVERVVGRADQRFAHRRDVRREREAGAGGHVGRPDLGDGVADPAGDGQRPLEVRRREHDRELLPTGAPHQVAVADRATDRVGCLEQHLVADRVPVLVVDPLEVVEVEQEQGEGAPVTVAPRERRAQLLVERAVVEEPRHRVAAGERAELVVAVVELAGQPDQPLRHGHADDRDDQQGAHPEQPVPPTQGVGRRADHEVGDRGHGTVQADGAGAEGQRRDRQRQELQDDEGAGRAPVDRRREGDQQARGPHPGVEDRCRPASATPPAPREGHDEAAGHQRSGLQAPQERPVWPVRGADEVHRVHGQGEERGREGDVDGVPPELVEPSPARGVLRERVGAQG
jgi:hypothetical protein